MHPQLAVPNVFRNLSSHYAMYIAFPNEMEVVTSRTKNKWDFAFDKDADSVVELSSSNRQSKIPFFGDYEPSPSNSIHCPR